jgi:tRNA threonylcarbamoyladenosine biosynthesis protein TsaB
MLFLGLNFSVDPFSIGLIKDDKLISEFSFNGSYYITENLIQEIDEFLIKNNVSFDKIKAIGFTNGPGSYTSIRVGISVIKSISKIHNIPLYPICSLEAIALNFKSISNIFFAFLPGRQTNLNCQVFAIKNNSISYLTPTFVWDKLVFLKKIKLFKSKIRFIGQLPSDIKEKAIEYSNINYIYSYPRGGAIAMNTCELYKNKVSFDLDSIQPNYCHKAI